MTGHRKWAEIRRARGVRAEPPPADTALETVRFEGYGPGGAAVLVECVTGDRGATCAAVRRTFVQHGGKLGADGSVSYLFNTVGLMVYPAGTDEERLIQVALEAGAEDVVPSSDHSMEVLADPLELETVRSVLTHHGFAPVSAEVTQRAATSMELTGEPAELMVHLLDALEQLDEVRNVYSNVEISDEVLARI